MDENKFSWSDIIRPDSSIDDLIEALEKANITFEQFVAAVKQGASGVSASLKTISSVAADGRANIDAAAEAASKLEHLGTTYNQLQNTLKTCIAAYKNLDAEQRNNSEIGRDLANAILDIRREIASVTAQIKPNINAVSDLSKAQEKLNFILSAEGQKLQDIKDQINDVTSARARQRKEQTALATAQEKLRFLESEEGQALLDTKDRISDITSARARHRKEQNDSAILQERINFLESEEGQRYLDLKAKLYELTHSRQQYKEQLTATEQAQLRLQQAQSEEAAELAMYNRQIQEANALNKLNAQLANAAEGSYNQVSAQYALCTRELNAMSKATREGTEEGRQLTLRVLALRNEMTRFQESTGNYSLNVGHYEKAFSGLGYSVSQVVRELPAATVSLNTFFLAISNNVPMVVDEIKKLRVENERLAAQGKQTINISKQIVKSLFSFNTILVLILTAFSLWGKQITNWITSLFKGKSAIISTSKALRNINKELKSSNGSFGDNIVSLKKLSREWKSLQSTSEKNQWIEDNKSEFNKLGIAINSVSDAENAFVKRTADIIEALKLRAKATAANKLASEQYEKALEARAKKEAKLSSAQAELEAAQVKYEALTPEQIAAGREELANPKKAIFTGDPVIITRYDIALSKVRELTREVEEAGKTFMETGDLYFDMGDNFNKSADDLLKTSGLYLKEGADNEEAIKDITEQLNNNLLRIRKKYNSAMEALERNEYDKRKEQAINEANEKIQELQNSYEKNQKILEGANDKYKNLTQEQVDAVKQAQEEIRTATEAIQMQLSYDLEQIEIDRQIKELDILEETIKLRLKAVKAGTEEEARLKLATVGVQQQKAILQNKKLPVKQQQSETDIRASFMAEAGDVIASTTLANFDRVQAVRKAEFDTAKHTARQIEKFQLEQERDRWNLQIKLAQAGALRWSGPQIEAAEYTVTEINNRLKELSDAIEVIAEEGFGTGILDLLGFNDEQIKALETSFDIIYDNLKELAQAEVDLAEASVKAAEKRVEAAQKVVDAEIEARNAGYANKVATAQKELELERKNLAKQQKQLEDAKRRQAKLDSITQASSLVTASAELWSSFSGMGPLGPALAIAAIATMWASFAVAKRKAQQAASMSQEYGEGGFEILEGGSHASGNDIDLHTKNRRGRNMRAEGGEALAIINKRSTAKYRSELPEIIKSINKGTFEDKYLNAFNSGDKIQAQIVNTNNMDLSKIESNIEAIKKQNNNGQIVLSDGTIIVKTGNFTRVIRKG